MLSKVAAATATAALAVEVCRLLASEDDAGATGFEGGRGNRCGMKMWLVAPIYSQRPEAAAG